MQHESGEEELDAKTLLNKELRTTRQVVASEFLSLQILVCTSRRRDFKIWHRKNPKVAG